MAEQEGAKGSGDNAVAGRTPSPQVGVIAQYVKDLSFENPNAPAVYQWQGQPQMDVQFNIGAQQGRPRRARGRAQDRDRRPANEGTAFQMELLYAGLFALRNIPEEQLQPFLLAEAPAPPVPVRAPDHLRRDHRRRLPAAAARPDRLRRPLSCSAAQAASRGDRRPGRRGDRPGLIVPAPGGLGDESPQGRSARSAASPW